MTALQMADLRVAGNNRARLRAVPDHVVTGPNPAAPRSSASAGRVLSVVGATTSEPSLAYPARVQRTLRASGAHAAGARTAAPRQRIHGHSARVAARRQQALLVGVSVIGMVFAFALGIFLYTALGFGLQAGSVTTVMAGDTLWSIASSMGMDLPTAQVVNDIISLNGLEGAAVEAGAQLLLPAY